MSEKLWKATESAQQLVFMREEATEHYGDSFDTWDRVVTWCEGFVSGWKESK